MILDTLMFGERRREMKLLKLEAIRSLRMFFVLFKRAYDVSTNRQDELSHQFEKFFESEQVEVEQNK